NQVAKTEMRATRIATSARYQTTWLELAVGAAGDGFGGGVSSTGMLSAPLAKAMKISVEIISDAVLTVVR
ncbi:UNVERIFIED_CONTAM: hypothetical protein NY603_32180, partial [Bacteroidetes bacterium 56_B9]